MKSDSRSARMVVFFVLAGIILLAVFRVLRAGLIPELPNFSPIAAVALCGGMFLSGMWGWVLPLGALFVSDMILAMVAGYPVFGVSQSVAWLATLAIVAVGQFLHKRPFSLPLFFAALLGSGLFFYFTTNTVCWFIEPAYPRGLEGLWMSLTTGLPGYPPSWLFYRNALISDLGFGAMIIAVRQFAVPVENHACKRA